MLCDTCANSCKYGYQFDCPNYKSKDVGERTQTNEEWLRTTDTESMAEFLCRVAVEDVLWDKIRQPYYTEGKQAIVEWLKEMHE